MRRHKETEGILKVGVIVKLLKYLRLRWYGHVDSLPKHVATATTEGKMEI